MAHGHSRNYTTLTDATRERIRQIEAKVVDRLVRREVWDDVLASKLQVMLPIANFRFR